MGGFPSMHMGNIPFILLKGLMMKTELTCPKCGETITVYEEDLDFGSIRCPKCDAELEFDMSPDDKDK